MKLRKFSIKHKDGEEDGGGGDRERGLLTFLF